MITWRKTRNVLGLEGEKADYLTELLCSSITNPLCPANVCNKSEVSCQADAGPAILHASAGKCSVSSSDIEDIKSNQSLNNEALQSLSSSVAIIAESLKKMQGDIVKIDANQIQINNKFMHNKPFDSNHNSIEVNDASNVISNVAAESIEPHNNTNLFIEPNNLFPNPTPKHLVPCPFLRRRGYCLKGSRCDFSHVSTTYQQPPSPSIYPTPFIPPPFPPPPIPYFQDPLPPMHYPIPPHFMKPYLQPLMTIPTRIPSRIQNPRQ